MDEQYISFPLRTDIMACQVSNGQFCHINSPLYTADTSHSCSYTIFLQNKDKINQFCTLSAIKQTQDEAITINNNFLAISTLQNNKKLYTTCFHYSYSISLHFPYNIVYLPDRCEANAITFILPSNNRLNENSMPKTMENKLGFNRSNSKINNFSLMQSLDVSSTSDETLKSLANKKLEMKHMSVFSINNTLTKLRSPPPTFWSPTKVKLPSSIGTPIMTTIVLALIIITVYCKCFQNRKVVYVNTLDHVPPLDKNQINLETILPPLPTNPDYVSPQVIQEILKTCGVELEKFKCYNWCKARWQTVSV